MGSERKFTSKLFHGLGAMILNLVHHLSIGTKREAVEHCR